MMTKREILIDDKKRVLNEMCRLKPWYGVFPRWDLTYLVLKCLNDLFEGEISRVKTNNISDTLRKYAERDDVDVVFKCILSEAAASLESVTAERDSLLTEVHILHREQNDCENQV